MINYAHGKGAFRNWIVSETKFLPKNLGKCESIMYLGNGYMGLRSATEEPYIGEKRNLFVSGTFNKPAKNEVTELPNLADVTQITMYVDGERFSLELGETKDYIRQLNLKTAELIRDIHWTSPEGKELHLQFKRFVSLDNLHLIGMKIIVKSITDPVKITMETGINGQVANSGAQHFLEKERRIFDGKYLQFIQATSESNIDVVINTAHHIKINNIDVKADPDMEMARRKVWLTYHYELEPDDQLELEKLTTVYTSRDKEFSHQGYELQELREHSLNDLKQCLALGYDELFQLHCKAWKKQVWDRYKVQLDSKYPFDELALRFSLYHLTVMTPAHDNRMGIAAKALSGEGYKGHSFWDTEIFILPFFTFSNPEIAKSLLIYRYRGLEAAREKSKNNGYEGAMYPWEAAWPTDGEVTPNYGDIDVVTGKRQKIWTGLIEQHITADIAFAVYQYYSVTGDEEFMNKFGYEMVFETAKFWSSRLEWNETKKEYHINDVIGPDEYKEHVDNNAYTNYMAYFNMQLAIRCYEELSNQNPDLMAAFDRKLNVSPTIRSIRDKVDKLYLPSPREEDLVIPQDDTYLELQEIDLTKYKEQKTVRSIYKDFNAEQINQIQVTKQTDTLLIFYLLEQTFLKDDARFRDEVKQANFKYYEPRTLHDSSLSLATHAIIANDLGKFDLAYSLFKDAAEIDLGPKMDTSDEGIHAAAIGGIWKSIIFGFAGIRLANGSLRINPRLPEQWEFLSFTIYWQGQPIKLSITQSLLTVTAANNEKITFEVFGTTYECTDSIEIAIK